MHLRFLNSLEECQAFCDIGCDMAICNPGNGQCKTKLADMPDFKGIIFKGQTNSIFNAGDFRGTQQIGNQVVASPAACHTLCKNSAECHFVVVDYTNENQIGCELP